MPSPKRSKNRNKTRSKSRSQKTARSQTSKNRKKPSRKLSKKSKSASHKKKQPSILNRKVAKTVRPAIDRKPSVVRHPTIPTSTPRYTPPNNTTANARILYEIYETPYRPPQWSLEFVNSSDWNSYAKTALVYHDVVDQFKDVRQVAEQREPVNIGMNRHYNSDALQKAFGYGVGGYQTIFEQTGQLPPNIAIYARTPFATLPDGSLKWNLPRSAIQSVNIHVINVTGYAFDSRNQVDYKFFIPLRGRDPSYLQLLVQKHKIVFDKIFACARNLDSEIIVLSAFGLASFATNYPDKEELMSVWLRGFEQSLYQFLRRGHSRITCIGIMGADMPGVKAIVEKVGMKYSAFGFLPNLLVTPPLAGNLDRTLFVNAWDPLSMVGNGNFGDSSLDGRIGRRSALAFLCWPSINPQIRYVAVG